jgi:hypothetical protein
VLKFWKGCWAESVKRPAVSSFRVHKVSLINAEDGGSTFLLLTLACTHRTTRQHREPTFHSMFNKKDTRHRIVWIHTAVILFEHSNTDGRWLSASHSSLSCSSHLLVMYTVMSPGYKKETLSVLSKNMDSSCHVKHFVTQATQNKVPPFPCFVSLLRCSITLNKLYHFHASNTHPVLRNSTIWCQVPHILWTADFKCEQSHIHITRKPVPWDVFNSWSLTL